MRLTRSGLSGLDAAIAVRPYEPRDRPAIRAICHATGFMGEPADWYWRDRESFADACTGYYTDQEPASSFVAVRDGRVVGYLLGCVDTARAPSMAEVSSRLVLRRALLLRPGSAGFFWRALFDALRDRGVPSGDLRDAGWPSHLHINLLPEARGAGAGASLMRSWLDRLAALGSPGCHLETFGENRNAIAFFERMGFRHRGPPTRVPGMRNRDGSRMHLQLMVRES
jgi:ribosomal protein S18 acetylase RimI-like enzyme